MKAHSRWRCLGALLLWTSAAWAGCAPPAPEEESPAHEFRIRLAPEAAERVDELGLETPVTGRVFVVLSRDTVGEPREQVDVTGVPFWGQDVEGLAAGETVRLDPGAASFAGYPLEEVGDVPEGEYAVQALVNVYTTFERADGHTLHMHLNSGAGQHPWEAPGNVRSEVRRVRLDPEEPGSTTLTLSEVIPPRQPPEEGESLQQGNPEDTEWVEYVKIRSDTLSAFWGRDMYIGANVLLPEGYDSHPETRYPVLYLQGHFPGAEAPMGFTPGGTDEGRTRGLWEYWTGEDRPRMIVVTFRDANPFFDTSYSVNSANVGPYGDALMQELIPHLEERFRIRREPWARVLAGGSTGGWEALALQVWHPRFFGGTWSWCPDPVDFHYYQIVDIYEDENAYQLDHGWLTVDRPNARRPDGNIVSTVRQENRYEYATGPRSRSGGQWDIWEAVFSPVGEDGFPAPIWDPRSGEIDREVAEHWRQNYDIHHYLRENWSSVGPDLRGKIHIATGNVDTYYLEEAVHLLEEFLRSAEDPPAEASVVYGERQPHCWIGESRENPGEPLTYAEFLTIASAHVRERAPDGVDPAGWTY